MHPRGRLDLRQRKPTAPHSKGKDGYKQMETFAIEQVMILMRFEHEFAIFEKIVDVRYRGFRPI